MSGCGLFLYPVLVHQPRHQLDRRHGPLAHRTVAQIAKRVARREQPVVDVALETPTIASDRP